MASRVVALCLLLALCFVSGASAKCHPDDEMGLLGFKATITSDPSGMLSTWKKGTECCQWHGVGCLDNVRVNTISLAGRLDDPKTILSGSISPAIAKLQSLDGIYFNDLRNLTGSFPVGLFHLPKLQFVYIENCGLSGQIPANIGHLSKLGALSLADNRFAGTIPSSISNLTELTQLKLGGNLLSGPLPFGMQRLKNLTYLSLEQNQLSGRLPDFSSFSNLVYLTLSSNRFSGPFPSSIAALSQKLVYLKLGSNSFTGPIPESLGNFKTLDTLDLSGNKFSGTIPKSFKNLTKIFNLNLSRNNLVDPFPEMSVKGIESLSLSYNKFHLGSIPKWVASSPIIYSLELAGCGLKMKLDDWKPSETYFYDYIDLSDNEVSGSPVVLLNKTEYLKSFRMGGNKLEFNMKDLKLPTTLKELDLSRNLVFGSIPGSVSSLEKLNLSNNQLCGKIPATKFPEGVFAGNKCLCGSPLAPCRKN